MNAFRNKNFFSWKKIDFTKKNIRKRSTMRCTHCLFLNNAVHFFSCSVYYNVWYLYSIMLFYQCFFLNFFFTIYFGRHILMTRWLFNLAFSVLFSRKNWRQKTKKLKCEMEKIKGSRGGEMVYASGTRNEIFGCVLWWKNGL